MIIETNSQSKSGGLDLSTLEIYIGDYLNTSSYTVTKGVVDKYTRELVS